MSLPATHPSADIWPLLPDAELAALARDIAARGQVLPIVTVSGLILDGRNRWLACELAGVEPWVEEIETDDPDALAWSLNDHRRHAPEGQRILAAARRANLAVGRPSTITATAAISQADVAAQFGVSVDSVQRGKVVLDHGNAAIVEAVERDELAVSLAAKAVRRIEETGQGFGSIAELKKTMRAVFREDNPSPAPAPREPRSPIDHVPLDTFGLVNSLVRHAEAHPLPDVVAALDKWTRRLILSDLSPAIAYLTELQSILTDEAPT